VFIIYPLMYGSVLYVRAYYFNGLVCKH